MKKQISILIISLLIQSQISAQWVNTNNLTNEVVTFAVMPDGMGGTKLFAGSYSGVYLSTDYGKNWISVNKGLTDKSIEALAAIGYYVFAATSSGIFRSTDSGLNWTAANNGLSYPDISSFAVWNTNIYAGGTGSDVYLSTNYGASWSRIGYTPRQNYVSSLAVSSVSPGNIEIFAANYSNGIYRSTDKGLNWNPANSGLSTSNAKYIKVLTSYVNASGSTTLFAGTTGDGVFRSTNSGIDWYQVPSGLTYGGLNVTSFVMSGTNVFAGTYDGVFLSTNNGKSWTSVNTGLPASTMVKSLTLCGRYLVAGTYNGDIWRRPLTEMIVPSQWIQTNGPYGSILPNGNYGGDVTSILITAGATGGTNIFAGTSGNGIFLTTDDGINWNKTSDLPNSNIQTLAGMTDDGGKTKIFAGTSDGIYLSTNSGTSWSDASAGLRVRDVKSIVIDSMDMYAGTDGGGVYLSTDRGKTWTAINNGSVDTAVLSMAVKGKDLYAGTKGGIYHSTDKGTSWTLIDWNYVWNRSLMLSGPHLLDGTGSTGIKLYADNGLGWSNFYSYLPSSDVRALVSSDKNIFAGIFADTGPYSSGPNSGVYLSTNNGLNWIKFNEGLDKTDVTALAVSGAYLYAGIAYQGVWRRSLSPMITSVETESLSLPAKLQLAQNYPNPFNPTTNISYSIPTESRVELKVFDILGREIATLINKDQSAGKYRVLFNGSSLPTGIYIYTLQAGQFRDSKKFLLLK